MIELGLLAQSPGALHYSTIELFVLRWEQGRLDEVEEPLRELYERTGSPVWRAALAVLAGETGNLDLAASELEEMTTDGCSVVPFDGSWLAALTFLSLVCLQLGDSARASGLYEALEPYRDRVAVLGAGAACVGPVSHILGVLAAIRGEREVAISLLEEAAEISRAAGSEPWLTRANLRLGLVLSEAHSAEGDPQRAERLVAESLATAQRLGMERLVKIAEQAQAEMPNLRPSPAR